MVRYAWEAKMAAGAVGRTCIRAHVRRMRDVEHVCFEPFRMIPKLGCPCALGGSQLAQVALQMGPFEENGGRIGVIPKVRLFIVSLGYRSEALAALGKVLGCITELQPLCPSAEVTMITLPVNAEIEFTYVATSRTIVVNLRLKTSQSRQIVSYTSLVKPMPVRGR